MPSIRVLVADDHPPIIEGVRAALARFGMEVVGDAETAAAVVPKYREMRPDVLVLDVRFGPGPSGLDVARDLLEVDPEARIVFYSQFDQTEVIRDAYRLGGAAFVTKNVKADVLAEAIKEAAAGKTYFVPAIAERLALFGVRGDLSPRSQLDDRETEIFLHLANGLTNNEIAERMKLSSKTIGMIGQAIREKLGAQRAADLTRLAVRYGMIEP
jgi:two-component system, NarL family, invasion response regulator UvrY